MMTQGNAPLRFPWPPVIFLTALVAALLLHWLVPVPWFSSPFRDILFAVGLLVAAGGAAFVVGALRAMRRAGTAVRPDRASTHLLTGGPFALSRNPIYLGATMLMLGAGLAAGNAWLALFAPFAAGLINKLVVEREEAYLAAHFGKRYRDYQKKVRRWL